MDSSKPRRPQARRLGAAALGGAAILALAAGPTFAHASTAGSARSTGEVRTILLQAELFDADADEAAQIGLLEDEIDGLPASVDQTSPDAAATPEPVETPDAAATAEPVETPDAAATPEPVETPDADATAEPVETPDATDDSGGNQSGDQEGGSNGGG